MVCVPRHHWKQIFLRPSVSIISLRYVSFSFISGISLTWLKLPLAYEFLCNICPNFAIKKTAVFFQINKIYFPSSVGELVNLNFYLAQSYNIIRTYAFLMWEQITVLNYKCIYFFFKDRRNIKTFKEARKESALFRTLFMVGACPQY